MRFFRKGKPSKMLGNNGITYGFFLPLRSLDRQFLMKNGQTTKIEEKTEDITYCLNTFFPGSIEGRGRKKASICLILYQYFFGKKFEILWKFFSGKPRTSNAVAPRALKPKKHNKLLKLKTYYYNCARGSR